MHAAVHLSLDLKKCKDVTCKAVSS